MTRSRRSSAADSSGAEWIELSVRAHAEAVDAIAEVFRNGGATGIAIEPEFESGIEGELAIPTGTAVVLAYLPADTHSAECGHRIEQGLWHLSAFDLAPISAPSKRLLREEDWANAWKAHYHPLRVGPAVVIKPSWQPLQVGPEDVVVELDPGMAFGTGLHPTTQLCLVALQRLVHPGISALDLGSGSGILAIAAAKLGARPVLALDTSPVAVRVAEENVLANQVGDRVRVAEGTLNDTAGPFDLIVANIIASVIADLAHLFASCLAPAGRLVACGIIEQRAQIVRDAFVTAGLTIIRTDCVDDWYLFEAEHSVCNSYTASVTSRPG